MKVLKGGAHKIGKITKAKVGVKKFTSGNLMNFFPLRRDKKEDT
jgi:hypothetical protein